MLVEDSASLAFHTAAVDDDDDEKFLGLAAFEKKSKGGCRERGIRLLWI